MWRQYPAAQQPQYDDPGDHEAALEQLKLLGQQRPLVTPAEIDQLNRRLARVWQGRAFILQGGACAERFGTPREQLTNLVKVILQMTMILMYGAQMEIVKLGRWAGQYAKPRSRPTDTDELPSYRGDLINSPEKTPAARRHDPWRLVQAFEEAHTTLSLIRELTTGGFADLRRIHEWMLEFVQGSRQSQRYERIAAAIDQALGFMEACGVRVRRLPATRIAQTFASHEGLVLDYEQALMNDEGYALSGHFLWVGERTRALSGAHIKFFGRVRNPVGLKLGPTTTAAEVQAYCRALNPHRIPGKLTFIARMGAQQVAAVLPGLMAAAAETGIPVIWACDPMHGNTIETGNGYKTRRIKDIKAEIRGFFAVCATTKTHPGGIHLELTGDNVLECLGGHDKITAADLPNGYETACDPRLNARQSLQIAFYVAKLLRHHRREYGLAA